MQLEAGEARALRQRPGGRIGGHLEIGLIVENLARLPGLDDMHRHGLLEEHAEMEEGDAEAARPLSEQGLIHVEVDLAPILVVELGQNVGRRLRGADIGRGGHGPGQLFQRVEGEGRGLAKLEARLLGQRRRAADGDEASRGRCGDGLEDGAAVDGLGHSNVIPCCRCGAARRNQR